MVLGWSWWCRDAGQGAGQGCDAAGLEEKEKKKSENEREITYIWVHTGVVLITNETRISFMRSASHNPDPC